MELINGETWLSLDVDVKGAIYEGLLEKNAEDVKGGAGQYFTPRPLIRAIVEAVRPKPGESIGDPACGTGGFFLAAHKYLEDNYRLDRDQQLFLKEKTFRGTDIVDSVARLCAMNLYLHGIGGEESPIVVADSPAPGGERQGEHRPHQSPFRQEEQRHHLQRRGQGEPPGGDL